MARVTDNSQVLDRVRSLAVRAITEPLKLTCVPPLGKEPYPYGDLVPLGVVLLTLQTAAAVLDSIDIAAEAERVRQYLMARRTRGLWAYQEGGLETSIDSGLVLLGMFEPRSVQELERFSDGNGGYLPQLHTREVEPGKMTVRDSLLHWCSADYSIATLVRTLRRRHALSTVTSLSLLESGFEQRSGLYLANPYFPDWLLAQAIQGDAEAEPLRERLQAEIVGSSSSDGLFGRFDILLSTALAILTLQALGTEGIEVHREALASLIATDPPVESTPFYSTEKIMWSKSDPWTLLYLMEKGGTRQLIRSDGQEHVITYYRDHHGLVVYSLVLLALLGESNACRRPRTRVASHPRYQSEQPEHYIAEFALPPYLVSEVVA